MAERQKPRWIEVIPQYRPSRAERVFVEPVSKTEVTIMTSSRTLGGDLAVIKNLYESHLGCTVVYGEFLNTELKSVRKLPKLRGVVHKPARLASI